MNYRTYFEEWKSWDKIEEKFDVLNGVYAFRLKSEFGRLKGKSSILYIGKCHQKEDGRSGLWHRIQNYRQNNSGASQRLKEIQKAFGGSTYVEYSYIVCENPREEEKKLLDNYEKQHLELPPLNMSRYKNPCECIDQIAEKSIFG